MLEINEKLRDLPSEIWSNVFLFLSIKDKRNVRLTCSVWYDACNIIQIRQYEKMTIKAQLMGSEVIFETLLKSKCKYFNIKFNDAQFSKQWASFWKVCGPRIHILKLVKCKFDKISLNEMQRSCQNLEYLVIHKCNDTLRLISNCKNRKIIQKNLISLKLKNNSCLSDQCVIKLFELYPNIKMLTLHSQQIDYYRHSNQKESSVTLQFSCIYEKIKLNAANFQKLNFTLSKSSSLSDNWFRDIAVIPNLKLQQLILKNNCYISENTFLFFFSKQVYLKKVKLIDCNNFSSHCLYELLENCPELADLEVTLRYDRFSNFTEHIIVSNKDSIKRFKDSISRN